MQDTQMGLMEVKRPASAGTHTMPCTRMPQLTTVADRRRNTPTAGLDGRAMDIPTRPSERCFETSRRRGQRRVRPDNERGVGRRGGLLGVSGGERGNRRTRNASVAVGGEGAIHGTPLPRNTVQHRLWHTNAPHMPLTTLDAHREAARTPHRTLLTAATTTKLPTTPPHTTPHTAPHHTTSHRSTSHATPTTPSPLLPPMLPMPHTTLIEMGEMLTGTLTVMGMVTGTVMAMAMAMPTETCIDAHSREDDS
mmetsp:Transcript_17094/g.37057  ORF Transcript_17094/g.37057 Transcript_17094/m.37057 type:complete len:251 (+) Transcript_17094:923-1675(+)